MDELLAGVMMILLLSTIFIFSISYQKQDLNKYRIALMSVKNILSQSYAGADPEENIRKFSLAFGLKIMIVQQNWSYGYLNRRMMSGMFYPGASGLICKIVPQATVVPPNTTFYVKMIFVSPEGYPRDVVGYANFGGLVYTFKARGIYKISLKSPSSGSIRLYAAVFSQGDKCEMKSEVTVRNVSLSSVTIGDVLNQGDLVEIRSSGGINWSIIGGRKIMEGKGAANLYFRLEGWICYSPYLLIDQRVILRDEKGAEIEAHSYDIAIINPFETYIYIGV
ncbi:MAG: hypothetical protein ACP5LQ_05010 [Candidatus Methanodesulfokora sp.]